VSVYCTRELKCAHSDEVVLALEVHEKLSHVFVFNAHAYTENCPVLYDLYCKEAQIESTKSIGLCV
jgi:hypothetical protein